MPLFHDQGRDAYIDVPHPLANLFKRFHLTEEELKLPSGLTLANIGDSIYGGSEEHREHYEYLKIIFKKLMEEDKTTHTLRTPKGKTIYEGAGGSRKPVRVFQSRWRMPTFMKSVAEHAEDASEDHWFRWVDEFFFAVLAFAVPFPLTESEAETFKQDVINRRLSPTNPKRKAGLEWVAEIDEEYRKDFPKVFGTVTEETTNGS